MREVAKVDKHEGTNVVSKASIRRYSSTISRVDLKYQNYDAKKVEVIKEAPAEFNSDEFYQAAVLLLIKMYEAKKLA